MNYWLLKSEPGTYSIDDLAREGFCEWDGIRNYQARNYMKDDMKVGDMALFYHSNVSPPGIAGICSISREARPDPTAWEMESLYYDPRSLPAKPVWYAVQVRFIEKFPHFISLEELKQESRLDGLKVLQKGLRLSITPVSEKHFEIICSLGRLP